jgi:hypothetical protein
MTVNLMLAIRFWMSAVPAIKQIFVTATQTLEFWLCVLCLNHRGQLHVLKWIML